jgi:hypothetical protein
MHLHWIPILEPLFSYCVAGGSPLDYLAWNASQAQGGSFMFDYLESNFEVDFDEYVDMEERLEPFRNFEVAPSSCVSMWYILP